MENSNLLKVSTYAKKHGISVQYVYQLIKQGKVKSIKIDGVCFVVTEKED